jgi:exopolysaccharide biosynthesis polyprenyl glycosylphosphotransferase
MLRRFGVNFAIFSLMVDASFVWLALALSVELRPALEWLPFSQPMDMQDQLDAPLYIAIAAIWIVVLGLFHLYDSRAIFAVGDELRILVSGSAFAGLVIAGLLYLSYRDVSRWLFLVFVLLAFLLLVAWRLASRSIMAALGRPPARHRVLICGTGPLGMQVGQAIESHRSAGLEVIGYLDHGPPAERTTVTVLGAISDLRTIVLAERVDEVVIALPQGGEQLHELVSVVIDIPLHVRVIPDCFTLALDRPSVEELAGIPMLDLRAGPLGEYQRLAKRLFDLVVSGVLLVVTAPLMAFVAVAIKLDSPGAVLFAQRRVGENGKIFTMYKFRSMAADAEAQQTNAPSKNDAGQIVHKRRDDPRVTRVGRFLRRTSLDELPQFFNVLMGDMSLVGPRPELPWLVSQYEPWQRRRLVVPQGMTGWWQVNGRSHKLMHLHTDDDLYYIANYSFWLDLRILSRTLQAVIRGEGAY